MIQHKIDIKCLIITDQYYPCSNANSICVRNLVNELKKQNALVDIISSSSNEDVIKIDNLETIYLVKNCNERVSLAERIRLYPIRDVCLAKKLSNTLLQLTKMKIYDFILFVVNPIESLYSLISLSFDKKTTKIIYELDSISSQSFNKKLLGAFLKLKSSLLEKKCYKSTDYIIHMECHRKEFDKPKYNSFKQKSFVSNFPLLLKTNDSLTREKAFSVNTAKSFIFCGSFDKGIRDPIPCLNIIKELSKSEKIVFDLFSKGDYEEELKMYSKDAPIIAHGYVGSEELEEHIISSSFLISIGNKIDNFVPSKMYSYLTYSKPIIHFYEKDSDPCLLYFSKVKHCLFINVNDEMSVNISKIKKFVNSNINVWSTDVFKEFETCTPSFTVDIFRKLVEEHESDKS